jgi:hypothetical protein
MYKKSKLLGVTFNSNLEPGGLPRSCELPRLDQLVRTESHYIYMRI